MSTSGNEPAPELFISLNGSLASKGQTVGGGDLVLFKFIRLSQMQPDVMIPKCAEAFAATRGKIFSTLSHGQLTTAGILLTFFVRIFQGIFWGFRNKKTYDIALAASPFAVDVVPVWFWKARRKGAVVYHLIPTRKSVNFSTRLRFGLAALEQKIMLAVLHRACDFIVAGNEFTKSQIEKLMPGKTIFILPAGFDAMVIDQIPAQSKDKNLACFVGRLVSQKGIFDLLQVMAELSRLQPEFRLVVAGSGPERNFFTSEIQRLKLTNIQLAGFVSEDEKFLLMKKSQYFFFPSYEEGWGIALAEALYCECKCICYELPHYKSIFGDFPGYARLGDTGDFLRAFRESGEVSPDQKKFVRQYDDPLVAQQMATHLATISENSTI